MIVLFLAFSIPPDWVYLNAKTVQDRHTQRGIKMKLTKESAASAERDARTLYDIATIRENAHNATREDVEFTRIAFRNWQFVADVAARYVEAT